MLSQLKMFSASTFAIFVACAPAQATAAQAAAAPQAAPAPAIAADDRSRVSLAGRVVSSSANAFQLDIGEDVVTVEMDDWDWFKEGKALKPGDDVVVSGRVDKDLWEQKKVEASSVFVANLGVTFYANGADEEDLAAALVQIDPVTATSGTVTAVEGTEFTIGSATGPVRVDLSQLTIRPMLKVGDRVHAWGDLDVDAREKLELMADGVVVLTKDQTKNL